MIPSLTPWRENNPKGLFLEGKERRQNLRKARKLSRIVVQLLPSSSVLRLDSQKFSGLFCRQVSLKETTMIDGIKGKVVIVTGGGHGIGRAYCHGFAEAGAKVIVADIDMPAAEKVAVEVVKQYDGKALGIRLDVANQESAMEMAKKTLYHFGTHRYSGQ